ncbi:Uncharacterised protein [Legionella beliardensis]|uniref:Uncharacterized protein n=1 Tax=Legionella beliardensis TaxID=91822 RepID=A0A378I636_9GAMM|nr:hypothetical protein [Legionella beliardensis]STX27934.1 Uncharacterised protein [Legionella beliardensis]
MTYKPLLEIIQSLFLKIQNHMKKLFEDNLVQLRSNDLSVKELNLANNIDDTSVRDSSTAVQSHLSLNEARRNQGLTVTLLKIIILNLITLRLIKTTLA